MIFVMLHSWRLIYHALILIAFFLSWHGNILMIILHTLIHIIGVILLIFLYRDLIFFSPTILYFF